jgi:hypothetical protein
MPRPNLSWWLPVVCLSVGCFATSQKTALVPSDPFGNTPPVTPGTKVSYTPAPLESAARVDRVGQQVLAANKAVGLRPQFRTIGSPQPELFHQGQADVLITDGLVKQCQTDGQLAALLCHELAKIVAEREALAGPQTRTPERQPPMEVRIGNDNVGASSADLTHLAELGKFERTHGKPGAPAPRLPDPTALARDYLKKAGFPETDYDAVQPYLRSAAENMTYARQLKDGWTPQPSWTK